MWPNSRISVMGGEQAASVLSTVKRDGIEAKGGEWSKDEEEQFKAPIRDQYEMQGHPYYATALAIGHRVIHSLNHRRPITIQAGDQHKLPQRTVAGQGRELEGEKLLDVQGAGRVLLVKPDVPGFLYLAVDDAFADQELRPLEIGVAGDEGIVKVEEGEVHGSSPAAGFR